MFFQRLEPDCTSTSVVTVEQAYTLATFFAVRTNFGQTLGVLCGLIFAGIDVALMIPLSFPDKRAAVLGAFIAWFAIGFVFATSACLGRTWAVGLFIGYCLAWPMPSLPKAAAPILGTGALGSLVIGWIFGGFGGGESF